MITENIKIEDSDSELKFTIGDVYRSDEDFFKVEVNLYFDSKIISKVNLTDMSEFRTLRNAIWYIGTKLRWIVKERKITLDLNGLTMDEYIPISRKEREIWDEN
jgi:hypothetical protein